MMGLIVGGYVCSNVELILTAVVFVVIVYLCHKST